MNELASALTGTSAFAAPKSILLAVSEINSPEKPIAAAGAATHSIYEEGLAYGLLARDQP